ncbi:hypothetical protein ACE193_03440 [Bernardetia sp. OM2101]|uniref:hypothetical protein n=1 Tax=Bernardetia sp. OM2101 TaxID=3344876 RepID=UPI0035D039FD
MYHTHQLNNSAHSHIIGRTDPITGDKITENDKVVFCKSCSSCFLEESWNYIGNNHCQQDETLDAVPLAPSKLLVKKNKNSIIVLKKRADTDGIQTLLGVLNLTFSGSVVSLFYYILQITMSISEDTIAISSIIIFLFIFAINIYISSRFINTDFFRNMIGFKKHDIVIFENRIEVEQEIFYWQDVEEIKFQRWMVGDKGEGYSKSPELIINVTNGIKQIKILPNSNYEDVELFLKGLMEIPAFVEVFLYTEEAREYATIKKLASRFSKGNINIKEPLKLLKAPNYPK